VRSRSLFKSGQVFCRISYGVCLLLGIGLAAADYARGTPPEGTSAKSKGLGGSELATDTRIYQTREEQREAGLKRRITPWLTVSGLVEAELSYDEYRIAGGKDEDASERDDSATLQLGVIADLFANAEAEVIFEYDTDAKKVNVDEAIFVIELDPLELTIGRQYTPFGTYISNFISDPLIEFAETRANRAVTLAYGPGDRLDVLLTLYRGKARRIGGNARRWDWALAIEAEIGENWLAGWSYQSDLADADSRPLADEDNRYQRRVAGISAFLRWSNERISASLEGLAGIHSYKEFDGDRNKPAAWNAELAYYFEDQQAEMAFRLEGSEELEGEPHLRYGTAVTWRFSKHTNFSLEYLRGEFKDHLATNDDEQSFDTVDRVAAKFSMEF
jgi:hypothetical protein